MGIPYSRQINAAFDQVTPLVAEAFKVLQTTKDISLLLAVIQVLTVLLQALTLMVLLAILLSINPDTSAQRKALVTPITQYLASWLMPGTEGRWILEVIGWVLLSVWFLGCAAAAYYFTVYSDGDVQVEKAREGGEEFMIGSEVESVERKDVAAVQMGSTGE